MIFDASPCPRGTSRALVIAAAATLTYPALFAVAAYMPFWQWVGVWETPRPPVWVSRLVEPLRIPVERPPLGRSKNRSRQPSVTSSEPASLYTKRRRPSVEISTIDQPSKPPAPVAVQSASKDALVRYEPLGRQDGPVPRIVIDTSFEDYVPVMRAYDAELALGLSYPAPNRNTWLYSLRRGELHQGVPARGAVPRLLRTALAVDALKPVVEEVANRLGAASESLRVYALYPEELHYGLVGKVRDVLAHAGAPPDSCAVVSFRLLPGDFNVEVHALARCP